MSKKKLLKESKAPSLTYVHKGEFYGRRCRQDRSNIQAEIQQRIDELKDLNNTLVLSCAEWQ
ncbi:MAG: hypothetical protein IPJ43_21195 [Saprospiraceae bacterium]|nr:hypothetical protein [Saprospiraceae bacterium]